MVMTESAIADDRFDYEALRHLEREFRDGFSEHLRVRLHRSISWIGRAEAEIRKDTADYDAAFIFYWIAFNSIYSSEQYHRGSTGEKMRFLTFFGLVVELDRDRVIYNAIWNRFSDSIRQLLNNRYVFQPFWDSMDSGDDEWEIKFTRENGQILKAFSSTDTRTVLCKLFDRLYVLRNQLMHGGATWNSTVNRTQVRNGTQIMQFLVPILVKLLMQFPGHPWGKPFFPVIGD